MMGNSTHHIFWHRNTFKDIYAPFFLPQVFQLFRKKKKLSLLLRMFLKVGRSNFRWFQLLHLYKRPLLLGVINWHILEELKFYKYLQNSTRLMKAEKSFGLVGCKLAAGSEVGITQAPVVLPSWKIVPKQEWFHLTHHSTNNVPMKLSHRTDL